MAKRGRKAATTNDVAMTGDDGMTPPTTRGRGRSTTRRSTTRGRRSTRNYGQQRATAGDGGITAQLANDLHGLGLLAPTANLSKVATAIGISLRSQQR